MLNLTFSLHVNITGILLQMILWKYWVAYMPNLSKFNRAEWK